MSEHSEERVYPYPSATIDFIHQVSAQKKSSWKLLFRNVNNTVSLGPKVPFGTHRGDELDHYL